jgi:hypothetical protein
MSHIPACFFYHALTCPSLTCLACLSCLFALMSNVSIGSYEVIWIPSKKLHRLSFTSCQSSFNRQPFLLVSSTLKPVSPACYHSSCLDIGTVCLSSLYCLLFCLISHLFCLLLALPACYVLMSNLTVLFSVCLSAFLFCERIQKVCSSYLSWFDYPFGLSFNQFLFADLFSCPPALCL